MVVPYALFSELAYRFYILNLPEKQQLLSGFMVEMILFPILQTVVVLYLAAAISQSPRSRYSVISTRFSSGHGCCYSV